MDLHEALWQHNFKRIKELVENGVEFNTDESWPPLLIAAFEEDVQMVKYLLNHGVKPTGSILGECIYWGVKPHIFKRLLKAGIDPNIQEGRITPLLVNAARFGRHRIVSRLLEAGADPNLPEDGGTTALMMASYYAHIKKKEKLAAYGADINRRDDNGENALFYAVAWAAPLSVFKWLVEHGIDLNVRTKKEGYSILQWLRGPDDPNYNPNNEVDKYLVSCGAKL